MAQRSDVEQSSPATPAVGRRRKVRPEVRRKPVPQRTCVACRQVEGKRALIRVVRTPGGTVEVDTTGRKNGRGAYLHADPACWDTALKRKALQHALKTELSDVDRSALEAHRASLGPAPERDGGSPSGGSAPDARPGNGSAAEGSGKKKVTSGNE